MKKILITILILVVFITTVVGASLMPSNISDFLTASRADTTGGGNGMLASPSEFTDNGCGQDTILDTVTNICWQKNWSGFLGTSYDDDGDGYVNWTQAVDYCGNLSLGDYESGNWTLPSIKEYRRLINETNGASSMVSYVQNLGFTNVQSSGYWSRTQKDSSTAWVVVLNYGDVYYDNQDYGLNRAVCAVWNN